MTSTGSLSGTYAATSARTALTAAMLEATSVIFQLARGRPVTDQFANTTHTRSAQTCITATTTTAIGAASEKPAASLQSFRMCCRFAGHNAGASPTECREQRPDETSKGRAA